MVDVPKDSSFRTNGRDKRYMYDLMEFKEYNTFFPTPDPEDEVMGLDFLLAEPSCNDGLVEPFLGVSSANPQKYYVTEDKFDHEEICNGTKTFDLTWRPEKQPGGDNSEQVHGTDEGILQEMNNLPSICEDYLFDCKLGGDISILDCDSSNGLITNQPNAPISDNGKECDGVLEMPIANLAPVESPSHQNTNLIDKMTIKELLGAFKDIFGREALVADRLWLKSQILFGLQELDKSYTGSNFSDFFSASSENCCKEMVNKSPRICSSLATGDGRGSKSSANLSNKECKLGRTSHGKEPLLCGSTITFSSVMDDGKLHHRDIDACSAQKRSRKQPARYIDEYSKYHTGRTSKRSGTLSKISKEKTKHSKSPYQGCMKEHVRARKLILHNEYITEAIQVPFGPLLLKCSDKKEPFPSDLDCNKAIIKFSEENISAELTRASSEDDGSGENDLGDVTRDKSGRKHNRYWSEYEIAKLIEGVAEYGVGRWTEIKKGLFPPTTRRTSVDLKDKWRNLLKACSSQLQSKAEGKRISHQQVPQSVLRQVKELSMMHPYPKIPSPKNALLVRC
ncbi:hypothetical protein QQ045_003155 [Rhodiola kirilowii]